MRTAEAIAKRALCVGLIATRSQTENGISNAPEQMADFMQLGIDLIQWAADEKITAYLSDDERALMLRPLGTWGEDLALETFWKLEALKALLWSINVIDQLTPFFELGNANNLYASVPVCRPIGSFVDEAHRRDPEEIKTQLEYAKFYHWRARMQMLRQQGDEGPPSDQWQNMLAQAIGALENQGLPVPLEEGDVIVDGMSYEELDGEEVSTIFSLCSERHLALQWICGDDDWDDTVCDV